MSASASSSSYAAARAAPSSLAAIAAPHASTHSVAISCALLAWPRAKSSRALAAASVAAARGSP